MYAYIGWPDVVGSASFHEELSLHLPDLDSFHFGPVEFLETPESSSPSSVTEQNEATESTDEGDIWILTDNNGCDQIERIYGSWEKFYDGNFQEPRSAYISEAGPGVFDAVLALQGNVDSSVSLEQSVGTVIRSDPLISVSVVQGRLLLLWY